MKIAIYVFLAMLLHTELAAAEGNTLTVDLHGLRNGDGNVRIGLYSDPATFRKESQALAIQEIPAMTGNVEISFADLPAGQYAIMAYHDENGDGQLNRRFGMFPTEGYGLSNNPKVVGPPAFAESSFVLTKATRIDIEIRY